jgi:hypothetical protein
MTTAVMLAKAGIQYPHTVTPISTLDEYWIVRFRGR